MSALELNLRIVEAPGPYVVRCNGYAVQFISNAHGKTFNFVADADASKYGTTEEAMIACVKHGLRSINAVIEPISTEKK